MPTSFFLKTQFACWSIAHFDSRPAGRFLFLLLVAAFVDIANTFGLCSYGFVMCLWYTKNFLHALHAIMLIRHYVDILIHIDVLVLAVSFSYAVIWKSFRMSDFSHSRLSLGAQATVFRCQSWYEFVGDLPKSKCGNQTAILLILERDYISMWLKDALALPDISEQ